MHEDKSALDRTIDLDRRKFTLASAMAILSGVAITITETACGSDYSPSNPSPTPTPNPNPSPSADKEGTISANHGHRAVVTGAQLTAGAAVNVELTAGNGHTHTASLTAAEVMSIAGGTRVSKESSTDSGHSHTVTFN